MRQPTFRRRVSSFAALAAVLALGAGCQTVPQRPSQLPPSLQLLDSAQLVVPAGCVPEASVRIDFVVLADGRTEQIHADGAPACLHDALTAWVESFRYAPPTTATEESVEWLLVSARRGS